MQVHCTLLHVHYNTLLNTYVQSTHTLSLLQFMAIIYHTDIDECELYNYTSYCGNYIEGGICNNTVGSYECTCPLGYTVCSNECIRELSIEYSVYILATCIPRLLYLCIKLAFDFVIPVKHKRTGA